MAANKDPNAPKREIWAGGVNLLGDAFIENPYPFYAELREREPVCFIESLNAWLLTRKEDVKGVGADPRLEMQFEKYQLNRMGPKGLDQYYYKVASEFLLFSDPPKHTRLRKLIMTGVSRQRAERHAPVMEKIAQTLIDDLAPRGQGDIVKDYASKVPLRFISALLGVQHPDEAQLEHWVHDWGRLLTFDPLSDEELESANNSMRAFVAFFEEIVEERRRKPGGDDLISELMALNKETKEPLSDFELTANLMLVYFASLDTTYKHFGNTLRALHDNPDQLAWLLEDPERVWDATGELMRFDAVGQIGNRIAREDLEIGGQKIRAGQTILPSYGAANHDPRAFANPETFDLQRPEIRESGQGLPYMTFGYGMHSCLGSNFARQLIPIMTKTFISGIPHFEIEHDRVVRHVSPALRGFDEMPARWSH